MLPLRICIGHLLGVGRGRGGWCGLAVEASLGQWGLHRGEGAGE